MKISIFFGFQLMCRDIFTEFIFAITGIVGIVVEFQLCQFNSCEYRSSCDFLYDAESSIEVLFK